MNEQTRPAVGRRVAELRKLRGLTQVGLAARLNRSQSWVTKIERGERRLDSIVVLSELARALSVPLRQLAESHSCSTSQRRKPGNMDLAELRRVLDQPATTSPKGKEGGSVTDLDRDVATLRRAYSTARYHFSTVLPTLPGLLRRARLAVCVASPADRPRAHAALTHLYVLTSAEFDRRGDLPRSRVALDRALIDAERSGDPLLVGRVGASIASFVGQNEPADGVAAAEAFIDLVTRDPLVDSAKGMLVLGVLYSRVAAIAARAGDEAEARRFMATATRQVEALGRDGVPFGIYFGPAHLAVYETRLLVELGYLREAARLGETIKLDGLANVNRAGLHAAYLARAQSLCGRYDNALATIAAGLRIAPEMFHDQARPGIVARDLVRDMLRRRRHTGEQLRRVARDLSVGY